MSGTDLHLARASTNQAVIQAPKPALRLDIQLLRAIAVGIVVAYHLWPNRFPGGFVGVDVFFVVSGFLITDHLMRSAESPGGVKLVKFWANRVRRLLPLSLLVLLVTAIGVLVFTPASTWIRSLWNIVWSSLYVQNWALASGSVNYLERDGDPVPTQHFWSLSTEEQFYLVWPILIVLIATIAVKTMRSSDDVVRVRRIRAFVAAAMIAITVGSLAYSLYLTAADPGVAYFATTTRAWEFAAGGLVALLVRTGLATKIPGRFIVLPVLGVLVMFATTLWLPEGTPFPGVAALLPVVATAFFLLSAKPVGPFSDTVLSKLRPLTYIGDLSYAIYLWHWPLILFAEAITNGQVTFVWKLGIFVVTLILAELSKRLVEDPFRYGKIWTKNHFRPFGLALAGMALVTATCFTSIAVIQSSANTEPTGSFIDGANDPSIPLSPSVALRSEDRGIMYDCFDLVGTGSTICSYGPEDADTRIAIVGDSHAAHLIPGLATAAVENGWRLDTYVGMNCDGLSEENRCVDADKMVDQVIGGDYDVVLVSSYRGSYTPIEFVEQGWQELYDAGMPLLGVADVPLHSEAAFACIDMSGGDVERAEACVTARDQALTEMPDRVKPIAERIGFPSVDFDSLFCVEDACRSVLQNTFVYQDAPNSHLTSTFSTSLAPQFAAAIEEYLETER
ncbi:acyltransferase family protein [Humidisolicoccus flavus]|uniref:acyltransferase family protein n=1 Tax=Humidisolicoccus flavus TaxID=3111414 RepID=UPI003251C852